MAAAAGPKVLSVILLVGLWWILSVFLPENTLPSPVKTAAVFWADWRSGQVQFHFLKTIQRIGFGFFAALSVGVIVGSLMGLIRGVERLLDTWVIAALTMPGLVYLIISFLWFGLNEAATVLAITATAAPALVINIWQGVKAIDMSYVDMARSFQAPPVLRFGGVILPQIFPYILSASRYGLGLIWKVTVFAEMMGRTDGIGYQLNLAFSLFDMARVLSWSVFFVIIMLVIEIGIFKNLERRLFAWRTEVRL
jgi:NitT/TauT family transport system permease protein